MKHSETYVNRTKLCYVLSYRFPNYVRTETLLHSLALLDNVEVYRAINTKKGVARYLQTLAQLLAVRLKHNPDVYILGFRGYEIFWPVRLLTAGKPLIYDEFVEPVNWFTEEHKKIAAGSLAGRLLKAYVRSTLKYCQRILYDSDANADLSAGTSGIDRNKYTVIPVGTDESVFKPLPVAKQSDRFKILFYGSMLPLHGIEHIVQSLQQLGDDVHLHLVGDIGKLTTGLRGEIEQGVMSGQIKHTNWIPYPELPREIAKADICLGGPFGGTSQARRVITGKTFQSLAMGKLTLIGKTDVKSVLEDGRNCLIAKQGSATAIAEKIRWAIHHPTEVKKIAENGRQSYLEHFSNRKVAGMLSELLTQLSSPKVR
ncbi:MAG: glycosyltransferase family 4 protein [Patescibacteria group bacterium]